MDDYYKTRNGGQGYTYKSPNMFQSVMTGLGNMMKPKPANNSLVGKLSSNRRTTQSQLDQIK